MSKRYLLYGDAEYGELFHSLREAIERLMDVPMYIVSFSKATNWNADEDQPNGLRQIIKDSTYIALSEVSLIGDTPYRCDKVKLNRGNDLFESIEIDGAKYDVLGTKLIAQHWEE